MTELHQLLSTMVDSRKDIILKIYDEIKDYTPPNYDDRLVKTIKHHRLIYDAVELPFKSSSAEIVLFLHNIPEINRNQTTPKYRNIEN